MLHQRSSTREKGCTGYKGIFSHSLRIRNGSFIKFERNLFLVEWSSLIRVEEVSFQLHKNAPNGNGLSMVELKMLKTGFGLNSILNYNKGLLSN